MCQYVFVINYKDSNQHKTARPQKVFHIEIKNCFYTTVDITINKIYQYFTVLSFMCPHEVKRLSNNVLYVIKDILSIYSE